MTPGNSTQQRSTADHFDELAALFLTESTELNVPVRARRPREASFRELLIVSNLPVRGGVWLAPYADAIAREHGPTALVRLDISPPTIELLRMPHSPSGTYAGADLKEAVTELSPRVSVWIIRGPLHREPADHARFDVDRITILTGADTMAVEAACGMVREIAGAAIAGRESGQFDLPPIALAVVGSGMDAAEEVVERVNKVVSTQFGIMVSLATCVPRMDAGIKCSALAPLGGQHEPTMRDLLEWLNAAEGASPGTDAASVSEADGPRLRLAQMAEEGAAEPQGQPDVVRLRNEPEPVRPAPVITTVPNAVPRVTIPPKPTRVSAPVAAPSRAVTDEVRLASFAGLLPLPLRCPVHQDIELASDEKGNVHVLARESSLRDLRVVESWVRMHGQILAMACTGHVINPNGDVICHIFTNEPATLADLHGTNLRLHVLAPVTVGGETTWYSAPLNRSLV